MIGKSRLVGVTGAVRSRYGGQVEIVGPADRGGRR